MDIMELGAIGELVGGVAVLVTLIYLAVQIRQGNERAKRETIGRDLGLHSSQPTRAIA